MFQKRLKLVPSNIELQYVLGFHKQETNPLIKRDISFTNVVHALRLLFFDDDDDVFIISEED